MTVKFISNDDKVSRYEAVVLASGEHKGILYTESVLEDMVQSFLEPIPLKIEFMDSCGVLDGEVGQLTAIKIDKGRLIGSFEVPNWLAAIEETPQIALSISRNDVSISGVSLWYDTPTNSMRNSCVCKR